jgi:glyoxylase-like metal-dependent hydrolase (beta-lactamase superfamily II)
MILETRAVAPFFKNGFVVACEQTRKAAIIDPGDEVDQLLAVVTAQELTVTHILLTHAHFDHVTGVRAAKDAYGAPIYLHRDDLRLYQLAVQQGRMFGVQIPAPPAVDRFYGEEAIAIGGLEVQVHHTPGHCPGGVCLQVREHLFVGDTLFAGGIGRTDLPGGDHEVLMRSITEVLFSLGDASIVHPGHGADTTIARERRTNPFVLEYLTR